MAKKRRSRQFKQSNRIIDIDEARSQRLEKRRRLREQEERERTASDERRLKRNRALRRKESRTKLFAIAVIVVLMVILCMSVVNILKLKSEQNDVMKKQEQLKTEQKQLEKELNNTNDEQSIEDKAREKLKLIKPGETIYIPPEKENQ